MNKTKRTKNARKTRSQIAGTFNALSNGQLLITDVLEDSPKCLNRVRIFNVMRRLPRLSDDGAEKVLIKARVWPLTRMRDLDQDERERIIAALPPRARN